MGSEGGGREHVTGLRFVIAGHTTLTMLKTVLLRYNEMVNFYFFFIQKI